MATRPSWLKRKVNSSLRPMTQLSACIIGSRMDVWKPTSSYLIFRVNLNGKHFTYNKAWFILRSGVKIYAHSNKICHLVDKWLLLQGLPWYPCKFCKVFIWLLHDSPVIDMWFSEDFHLIPLFLSSTHWFQNRSHKLHIFNISTLMHLPLSNSFWTIVA